MRKQVTRILNNRPFGLWTAAGLFVLICAWLLGRAVLRGWLLFLGNFGKPTIQLTIIVGVVFLFIGLSYLMRPDHVALWAEHWLEQKHRVRWGLILLMLAYVLIFGWMVTQRHARFNSSGYDLGIQAQVVWNTSRGYLYHSSVEVDNYLGDHFQPLMILLAPLCWFLPSTYGLLAFQTIVLALGAIPLFRLAQRQLGSPWAGLAFALVYLLYPAVGYINRFDFHWEHTVIPLFLAAADAVDTGQLGWASLFLALAMLGKEEIGLTVAAFGLLLALHGRWKFGVVWSIAGVGFSLVVFFVLMPLFRGAPSDTLGRYKWLDSMPVGMLETLITHPHVLLQVGMPLRVLSLGLQLLIPLAFLPLMGLWTLVVTLPSLGYNLLSSFSPQHTIYGQYMAPTVPFILIAAVQGMGKLQRALSKRVQTPYVGWGIWAGLLLCTIHAAAVISPLRDIGLVPPAWPHLHNETAVRAGLAHVPPDVSVFTTNHYAPHLSQRYTLYVFVYPNDVGRLSDADVAFFNVQDHRSVVSRLGCEDYRRFLGAAAQTGFGVVFNQEGVVVLQREKGEIMTSTLIDSLMEACEDTDP